MDQKRLDSTIIRIGEYVKGSMTHAEFLADLDYEAAAMLNRQGLATCQITQMDSGRYRFRWTTTTPLTPAGKDRLEKIASPQAR